MKAVKDFSVLASSTVVTLALGAFLSINVVNGYLPPIL